MAKKRKERLASASASSPNAQPSGERTPQNVWEAIFSLFWGPRTKYPFIAVTGLVVVVYAVWAAIPAEHQKALLSKIIPLPTPSPSPVSDNRQNLPIIVLNVNASPSKERVQTKVEYRDVIIYQALPTQNDCAQFHQIPTVPSFNIFPITYGTTSGCFDLPLLRMRKVVGGKYPSSDAEAIAGVTASLGEELFASIFIDNGAVDLEHSLNTTTARDVRITTTVSNEIGTTHSVTVLLTAKNAEGIQQKFPVHTGPNEKLELVPESGELFDAQLNVIDSGAAVGNNTVSIGDIKPGFANAKYLRFRVKVVGA